MGIPKVWLNCDEFVDLFKAQLEPILKRKIEAHLNIFDACTLIMNEIYDLMPEGKFKDIAKKIDDIIFNLKYNGSPRVDGVRIEVPPLKMDYDVIWNPPEAITLTGIQFELSGWKSYDRYSLIIQHFKLGKLIKTQTLINKVPFKEVGEHKVLPIAYPFGASKKGASLGPKDNVIFRIHNDSGNSRQTYLDFEYLTLGDLPPAGATIIFLDVSGSMWGLLEQMSSLMIKFLQNLWGTDPVSICFVAGVDNLYRKGTYDFKRKDFANKYLAIAYLSTLSNIPSFPGGTYDIVSVQCVLDYKINNFDNYIFCTDQHLESDPDPNFIQKLKDFFTEDQNVFSIPPGEQSYWNDTYKNTGLFKPIKV